MVKAREDPDGAAVRAPSHQAGTALLGPPLGKMPESYRHESRRVLILRKLGRKIARAIPIETNAIDRRKKPRGRQHAIRREPR